MPHYYYDEDYFKEARQHLKKEVKRLHKTLDFYFLLYYNINR